MTAKDKKELLIDFFNFYLNTQYNMLGSSQQIADAYKVVPQALQTLKKHQEWLNGGVGQVIDTKELAEANETIINYVENMLK